MVDIKTFLRESNAIEGVHEEKAVETAHKAWKEIKHEEEMTKSIIKKVHEILLENRQPEIAGEYRDCHVRVNTDRPPGPDKVPELMDELVSSTPETHLEAIDWHIRFEKIHPFADGNGRAGRLIYLWHCYSHQNHDPIIWRADDRHGYYSLFNTKEYTPKSFD